MSYRFWQAEYSSHFNSRKPLQTPDTPHFSYPHKGSKFFGATTSLSSPALQKKNLRAHPLKPETMWGALAGRRAHDSILPPLSHSLPCSLWLADKRQGRKEPSLNTSFRKVNVSDMTIFAFEQRKKRMGARQAHTVSPRSEELFPHISGKR